MFAAAAAAALQVGIGGGGSVLDVKRIVSADKHIVKVRARALGVTHTHRAELLSLPYPACLHKHSRGAMQAAGCAPAGVVQHKQAGGSELLVSHHSWPYLPPCVCLCVPVCSDLGCHQWCCLYIH